MANASIYAAFERMWQHIIAKLGTKVDKVSGKDLSSNDYTDEDKNKLNNIDTVVSEQVNSAMEGISMIDIDLDGSNEGEINLLNADTLGGHLPEYYATTEMVNNITPEDVGAINISNIINNFTTTDEGFVADARALKTLNDNKIEMELLWETAASSVADSTLTLTNGNFSHFLVDFYGLNQSRIIRAGSRVYCSYETVTGTAVDSSATKQTEITINTRLIDFRETRTTNTVPVGACYVTYYKTGMTDWSPTATNNSRVVPVKIWGIRGIE